MGSKKRLQKKNHNDDAYFEIRKLFSGYLQIDSCRKSHSVAFGKCDTLVGLWAAYVEVFVYIYIDCKKCYDFVTSFAVIARQLRSLLRAFFLPEYVNEGCFHAAHNVAFISPPL